MISSNSNIEIYHLLEKSGNQITNFSKNEIIDFDWEDDFHLVLYNSVSRNFMLLKAQNYLQNPDELSEIVNKIHNLSADNKIDAALYELALEVIENKIRGNYNSLFFFDAH